MASTKILDGNTIMIVSALKKAELLDIQKYHPSALVLCDDEKNPVFAIGIGKKGGINEFGIIYSGENSEGFATSVITFEKEVGDRRQWVIDELGVPLSKLEELEGKLPEVVNKIATNKARIGETVTMA